MVVGLGLRRPTKVEERHAAGEHRDLAGSGSQAPTKPGVGGSPPEPSGRLGVLGDVVDEVVGGDGVVHAPIGRRDALQVIDSGFGDVERAFWPATGEAWRGDHKASSAAQLAEPGRFPQPELLGRALIEQAKQPPIELARPLLATFPLSDHVGIDADPDALVDPCEPSKFLGDGLLG